MSDEIKSTCSCADKKEEVKKPVRQMGPIETSLFNKIQENLCPEFLKIRNDSWKHAHHSGMKTAGNTVESHFHITIVSGKFNEPLLKGSLARHRYIFKLLDDEVKKIHGFQVICKTPTEWERTQTKTVPRESSAQYFS